MYRYWGFGLSIDSELELPELPGGDGEPDVVIRCGPVPYTERKATLDEEFAFNSLAGAFHIKQGREIVVDPLPGGCPKAVRVILLGRIMAFLLRQRGWLPLHASVVVVGGQAVLFLAPSGGGKSTVAAAFHACGHLVVADDVGAVRMVAGQCIVRPAWSRIRLLDDSSELLAGLGIPAEFQLDKHSYDLKRGRLRELFPVNRIYFLESGKDLRTEVVPPLLAASLLSRHSFSRHAKFNIEALQAHLRDCTGVASSTRLYRLERPESLCALSGLVSLVEREMARS